MSAKEVNKNREEVIQHLQMIQVVITRMNSNSFSLKWWSIAFLLAFISLIFKHDANQLWVSLIVSVAMILFWYLDSFYLWQERGYRVLYDEIRMKKKTDFEMRGRTGEVSRMCAFFSKTICIFYVVALMFAWFPYFY